MKCFTRLDLSKLRTLSCQDCLYICLYCSQMHLNAADAEIFTIQRHKKKYIYNTQVVHHLHHLNKQLDLTTTTMIKPSALRTEAATNDTAMPSPTPLSTQPTMPLSIPSQCADFQSRIDSVSLLPSPFLLSLAHVPYLSLSHPSSLSPFILSTTNLPSPNSINKNSTTSQPKTQPSISISGISSKKIVEIDSLIVPLLSQESQNQDLQSQKPQNRDLQSRGIRSRQRRKRWWSKR
jgi:hypothetical protein